MDKRMKTGFVLMLVTLLCFTLAAFVYTPPVKTNLPEVFRSQRDFELSSSTVALSRNEDKRPGIEIHRKEKRPHPSYQHERLRRKLELEVSELGYFVQSQIANSVNELRKADNNAGGELDKLKTSIGNLKGYVSATLSDLKRLRNLDRQWREEKFKNLSKIIQMKIHEIMFGAVKHWIGRGKWVHVRRTDKLKLEAKSYPIEQYMAFVEEYYTNLELRQKVDKRRVFLATDEPQVVERARQIYPHYEIINDINITKSAALDKRYAFDSLVGLVTDLQLLAESDFLVCTFSSNFGRAAYELMQAVHGDASQHARSLDTTFCFHGQTEHLYRAIQDHAALGPGELVLNSGDELSIEGDLLDEGYSKGHNKMSGQSGMFPAYKVEDTIKRVKYSVKFF